MKEVNKMCGDAFWVPVKKLGEKEKILDLSLLPKNKIEERLNNTRKQFGFKENK